MSLRPIGERVIVKKIESEQQERTAGGIILTSRSSNMPDLGIIAALGTSDQLHEMKTGDKIYFEKGKEISFKGESYYVVNLEDIYAVRED